MKNRSAKLLSAVFIITGVLLLNLGAPVSGLSEALWGGTVVVNVNLRKTPSLQGVIVSGLLQGSPVKIYAEKDGWYRISAKKYHQVFNGWVSIEYVAITAVETTPTPPGTETPEPDHPAQSLSPVGVQEKSRYSGAEARVQSAPIAPPEVKSPQPEATAPVVSSEPEPVKRAAAKPPTTKMAATKSTRPPRAEKRPLPDAGPEPADDPIRLLPTALPVLAVIVLLIVVIVYRVRRASGPKAEKTDLPEEPVPAAWSPPPAGDSQALEESELTEEDLTVDLESQREPLPEEPAPAAWSPPPAENSQALEESAPMEEELPADIEFQMESTPEDRASGDDDDSATKVTADSNDDSPTKGVSIYGQAMEKINRMSDVELTELLDLIDDHLGETQRMHDRLSFYTMVDYVVEGQYYRDFIQDLSVSGVFIKARQMFEPGQHILMTFMAPFLQKPFKISGEIVRILNTGIGVNFDKESQVQTEAISALMDQIRMIEKAG